MKNSTKKYTIWIVAGISIFLMVFIGFSYLYLQSMNVRDDVQINTHAVIISGDIWNLNKTATKSYLQLALFSGNYKTLTVTLSDGETFLQADSPPLTGLDKLLFQLNFLGIKELSSQIEYDGQEIGVLYGEKYVRAVYPLFNIFLFQLFVIVVITFILYLFYNRKFLEKEVQERTKAFRESEGRFHELVNLLPEMVLEADVNGNVTYANEMAVERFGFQNQDAVDGKCFDLIMKDQANAEKENFINWIQEHKHELHEYNALSADGSLFPVLIRYAPIYKNEQISGARILIIDITERCALEQRLSSDQKMKTIGMMAGGVAHDLNNILSGLINYPELLLLKLPADSELREDVKAIKKSGQRAAEVVADLLTVARGIAAIRKTANLNDLVEEYLKSPEFLKLQEIYPDFSFKVELGPNTCNISCSLIHVRKCLMNLIMNAIEAMDGKGQVTISTSTKSIDTPIPNNISLEQDEYTVLSVHDVGPGISPSDIDRIFEPFYTKKKMGRSGTGLGLSVVWNTMQDHNGTVKVIGDDTGTTFQLFFPCVTDNIKHVDEASDWQLFKGNGETILVIDDELHQQDIAMQLLESLGYKVYTVSSGEEAFAYVRQHPVDLLLLDMILGTGLNGREVYEKILHDNPDQRAVIVSGFSVSDDVKGTLSLGAGSMISKPYTKEQLSKAVYEELNR